MRVVLQRVASAGVKIDGATVADIGRGLLVLLGIARGDAPADAAWLAQKIATLRIFPDEQGQMNRSVVDVAGGILVVSQFTLHASTRKGARPSYNDAAKPDVAIPLYDEFILQAQTALGRLVQSGRFGAMMQVSLVNDGPVTIIIDSKTRE